MPELDVLLLARLAYLHSYLSHVGDRGVGPVTVTADEGEQLLHLAQIGLRTVFGKEGVDFIASLPVGHVRAEQTAVVARFIDQYLGVELVLYQRFAHFLCHLGKLAVGCRTTFLLRSGPVPVAIRLINRTDVVEVNAIVLFDAFERSGDKLAELSVAVILQVERAAASRVGGKSVLGIENRG